MGTAQAVPVKLSIQYQLCRVKLYIQFVILIRMWVFEEPLHTLCLYPVYPMYPKNHYKILGNYPKKCCNILGT